MENIKAITWNIKVTQPSPSMNKDVTVFTAATYAEAVEFAHAAWMKARRPVVLCSGEFGNYFYHRVDSQGVATDRNTNSGVPALQTIGGRA